MPTESKLLTMRDAIARHVPSGSMVLLGAQLEQMIPFAAGHELIRQSRRDLTLVGPISDILFDQMIGAGCVSRVMAAWVGNVSAGVGYCFRRAVERSIPRRLEVVDYSNFTMALALHAAALGVPFLPTYATLGSDLLKKNGNLREFSSPVSEEKLVAVRALRPDVAILHVQRSDAQGNAHLWGSLGVAVDGARAARKVIVVAEEIVEPSVIASDPNRTLIPGFLVAAVVHEPGGAHPSPVQGYLRPRPRVFHRISRTDPPPGRFRGLASPLGHAGDRSHRVLEAPRRHPRRRPGRERTCFLRTRGFWILMTADPMANIEITPREVKDLLARDPKVLFVDVREQWEYDTARIAGSVLIPLGEIPSNLQRLESAEHVVFFCHHGMRSLDAAAWLRSQGVETAQSMTGGIERWSTEIDPSVPRY